MGKDLGYELKHVFNYHNNLNEDHYPAASYDWIDSITGHNFSNVQANRDYLSKLQKVRLNVFCIHRGRVIEH